MDRKHKLIEQCIVLMDGSMDSDTKERALKYYENFDESYLEQELSKLSGLEDAAQAKANARRQQQLWLIFRDSGLENTVANEALLEQMMPAGTLSAELFHSLLKSNPGMASRFSWTTKPFQAAIQKQETATRQEREAFLQAMRELVASPNEANFSLVRGALGSGYSVFDIKAAVQSGQIQLAAASAEEMAQYHQDAIDAHQNMLKNLAAKGDVATLRLLARQEAEANRRTVPQQQAEMNLEGIKQRDSYRNYPLLPVSVTKFQIQSASREYTAILVQKYGQYQLLNRLMTAGE